jgi:hypothetical protein
MRPCYAADAHTNVMGCVNGMRKDRAGTPCGAPVSGKCVGKSYATADKSSVREIRTSGDTRSDRAHARFVAHARHVTGHSAE